MSTTYFNQALTEVQSTEFTEDMKATVRFIFRLIKLLFLLLTAIFTLCKFIYLHFSRQGMINQEGDLYFKQETLLTSIESDRTVNDSIPVSNPYLTKVEDNLQQEQSEGTLLASTDKVNNTVDRQKKLKLMKAAQLRKLCTDYFISYKNKQQAIEAILQFELEQLQGNLG
jgi:hypothetical protein